MHVTKRSRPLSDQLIAFKFAVKLLDDLGVKFRMKTGRHGISAPQLPDTIVLSFDPACLGKSATLSTSLGAAWRRAPSWLLSAI
jgi:hypothetical protein